MKAAKRSRVKHTSGTNDRAPHLAEAAFCGTTAEVRKLVLAGAKVNAADQDGFTALMFAIMRGNEGMADYLIDQKADVNRRNKVGQTALMLAAQGGHKKLVEHLIRAGADVGAVDEEKRNAVSWAARRGDFFEVISTLVVFKGDPDAPDVSGITPLMAASLMGHAESVAVLLTVGADEKAKFRGKTAYQMAAEKHHTEVCRTMKAVLANRPHGAGMSG